MLEALIQAFDPGRVKRASSGMNGRVNKANRRTVGSNGREDPSSRQPNAVVTETVTQLPTPRKEKAVSRALDATTNARAKTSRKKKAKRKPKRKPCIIPGIQRLYSVKEAASYLRLSPWTIRSLGWNGGIPQVRIARRILFDREDLDQFVERSKR